MAIEKGRNIAVAIYSHPGFYPPLLNAIDSLAGRFSTVRVISRNLTVGDWKYPANVKPLLSGKGMTVKSSEQQSTFRKAFTFYRFTRDFLTSLRRERYEWVMCNDPISLFSFRMIRRFIGYPIKLWYHSHDVSEIAAMRKYSIGYFSVRSESHNFHLIELFTLPSEARLRFYPVAGLKGKYFIVPNYPSLFRIKATQRSSQDGDLRLIYQGRISDEHGLDEIIDFVEANARIRLTVIGPGPQDYIQSIKEKVDRKGIGDRVSILDPVPYEKLNGITAAHHIGLAINKPMNILYRTGGLASNKIYEYAASGLPIIYYRDEHYTQILGRYRWAFSTDLSLIDLESVLQNIQGNYSCLSESARRDIDLNLNFEMVFRPVLLYVLD